MSSSLTLIQAISPCLIGLSFVIPFIYGWVRKTVFSAVILGWCLCVLSALLSPIYIRLAQLESIDKESSEIQIPEQASVLVVICVGWILPLCGYFLGKKLREIRTKHKD